MITNKKHKRILREELEDLQKCHQEKVNELTKELEQTRDLKRVIEKLYPLHSMDGTILRMDSVGAYEINDGEVETGLTKQKPDKGFTYKLVRK